MSQNNPLLQDFNTPFGVVPFSKVQLEHYQPAVEQMIKESLAEIEAIALSNDQATFQNTIVALERVGEKLNRIVETFFNLNSAETSEAMQALANEISPLMTEYGNEISQNVALFARVKAVFDNEIDNLSDPEDKMLLEKSYKGFVRSGANLNETDKATYRQLSKDLSMASLKFGENVLAETNAFEMVIDNEADLAGLPDGAIEAAAGGGRW
jgi:peptidyl-dipeptidase Dcp